MNLRTKVILLYLCIMIVVLICIGGVLPSVMHGSNLAAIESDTFNQVQHIDFALTRFIGEVKNDVREIALHENVRNPDDTGFTTFLSANETSFLYQIGDREENVIEVLDSLRLTHPHVNSVYMGRETGVFVRSHERMRATQYDPRTRPWYILGKENPGRVMMTEPYPSVTSSDVNIGIVTAQVYPNNTVYGVIGADITLVNLTDYISSVTIGKEGEIILTNQTGTILAAKDPSLLFTNVSTLLDDQTGLFLSGEKGILTLHDQFLMYYTSPDLSWKYCVIYPFSEVETIIRDSIISILAIVFVALLLLSFLTLVLVDHTIIKPLSGLTRTARIITETQDLNQEIKIDASGEIGDLTWAFGSMIETIRKGELDREEALSELASYRDHLEDLVRERTAQLEEANAGLEKAKERAEMADHLKSAFLATMSHELRTPLNSIIGFTGIILQGLTGPLNPEQEKQLGMVQNSARHLLALINDVLDISKIEAGELSIGSEPVDITASIMTVVDTMQPIAAGKGLVITTDLAPDTGMVMGDKRRIEQIFMNLLSNAVKFTEQGSVTVRSFRTTETVVVSV
ncbi:MAG: HAMP domain-containing protein, partial [Methanospirillaceae archaeon]|nr:HAMP domain-containing protein [Methanospirillaceae archaeon]